VQEYLAVARALGVDEPPPELDSRTAFWVNAFNLLCRGRPQSMAGVATLPPLDILQTAERLQWPCQPDECVEVVTAMDDMYLSLNQ
jgi:hypothetical protein